MEEALAREELDAAIERAERAIAAGAERSMRGALRLVQADARFWKGDLRQAWSAALEATQCVRRGAEAWFSAIGWFIATSAELGNLTAAGEWIDTLFSARAERDSPAATVAVCRAAIAMAAVGRPDLTDRLVRDVEQSNDVPRSPHAQAFLRWARACRKLGDDGDLACFVGKAAEAVTAFEQAGDFRHAALLRCHSGCALLLGGAVQEGMRALRTAHTTATQLGLAHVAALCEQHMSETSA